MTEKDNSTKLTWLTWHNIPYIPQNHLRDPSSLYVCKKLRMPQSIMAVQ